MLGEEIYLQKHKLAKLNTWTIEMVKASDSKIDEISLKVYRPFEGDVGEDMPQN